MRKVVEKSRGPNPVHLPGPSLKIQMLGKLVKLQILTWKFIYKKACLSGFHTHQSGYELSLELLRYCSSKIAISRVTWKKGGHAKRIDPLGNFLKIGLLQRSRHKDFPARNWDLDSKVLAPNQSAVTVDSNSAGTFQKFSPAWRLVRHNSCSEKLKIPKGLWTPWGNFKNRALMLCLSIKRPILRSELERGILIFRP